MLFLKPFLHFSLLLFDFRIYIAQHRLVFDCLLLWSLVVCYLRQPVHFQFMVYFCYFVFINYLVQLLV